MKKKILRFGKGLIDGLALGVPSAIQNAKASVDGGSGKHDKPKNTGYIAAMLIIAGVIFNFIELEEGESLFKFLIRFGFLS
jgi:hypothetical protein